MSEQVVYKVKVNGSEYGADDKASAEALAELLGGEVFTTSRKDALAHIRKVTAKPDFPPVLNDMLAEVKETIVHELTMHGLVEGSCFRMIVQYDSKGKGWYSEVKNFGNNSGPVYNQVTGEKYPSIAHARWENGKSCAVKYLANGVNAKGDKFGKGKPASAK